MSLEVKLPNDEFKAELESAAKKMQAEKLDIMNVPGSSGFQMVRGGSSEDARLQQEIADGEETLLIPITLEGQLWFLLF